MGKYGKLSILEKRREGTVRIGSQDGKVNGINKVNSVYWKRGCLNNIGRGGQGEGKWVNMVKSVNCITIKT